MKHETFHASKKKVCSLWASIDCMYRTQLDYDIKTMKLYYHRTLLMSLMPLGVYVKKKNNNKNRLSISKKKDKRKKCGLMEN